MTPAPTFADRTDAGRQLADALAQMNLSDPLVLALPRGGVPVAAEIARRLAAPLDLIMVRKIGAPMQPELALGAVVDGAAPECVLNPDVVAACGLTAKEIDRLADRALAEIARRRGIYLKDRTPLDPTGRTVIVVDDGIATGASVRAALQALRRRKPARLILAVSTAPAQNIAELRELADHIVCLSSPEPFRAVGLSYRDFSQLSDADVVALLERTRAPKPATRM